MSRAALMQHAPPQDGVERTDGWRSDMHYGLQVNSGRIMRSVWTSNQSTGCTTPGYKHSCLENGLHLVISTPNRQRHKWR
jgi:hypothetical protein